MRTTHCQTLWNTRDCHIVVPNMSVVVSFADLCDTLAICCVLWLASSWMLSISLSLLSLSGDGFAVSLIDWGR